MYKCIVCFRDVDELLKVYGAGHVVLSKCPRCQSVADMYVEHNSMLVFIDMLLHKRAVYRHLLFNGSFQPPGVTGKKRSVLQSTFNFAVVLILFEVYIKWHILEQVYMSSPHLLDDTVYTRWPIAAQYVYVLVYCTLEFICFRLGIASAACMRVKDVSLERLCYATVLSFLAKGLILAVGIWDYGSFEYAYYLNFLTLSSTVETVAAMLNVSWVESTLIVGSGVAAQKFFQSCWSAFDASVRIWQ